jgi:hypothetical protein
VVLERERLRGKGGKAGKEGKREGKGKNRRGLSLIELEGSWCRPDRSWLKAME